MSSTRRVRRKKSWNGRSVSERSEFSATSKPRNKPRPPDESVATAKEQLRRTLRQVRDSISPVTAADAARAAAGHLLALPPVASAHTVAVYAAARGELDTASLCRELVGRGARLVYPRVQGARD